MVFCGRFMRIIIAFDDFFGFFNQPVYFLVVCFAHILPFDGMASGLIITDTDWSYDKIMYLGALAQLVARFHGMEEVIGSNPICSTIFKFYYRKASGIRFSHSGSIGTALIVTDIRVLTLGSAAKIFNLGSVSSRVICWE